MRLSCGLLLLLVMVSQGLGQSPLEEKPKVVPGPTTAAEKEKAQAEELRREAVVQYALAFQLKRKDVILDALKTAEKAERLDPGSMEIKKLLMHLQIALHRVDQALKYGEKIFEANPGDVVHAYEYVALQRADAQENKAYETIQRCVEKGQAKQHPSHYIWMLNMLAERAQGAEQFEESNRYLTKMIPLIKEYQDDVIAANKVTIEEVNFRLAKTHEQIASNALKLNKPDQAAEAFRDAQTILFASKDPVLQARGIRVYLHLSELATAKKEYKEALDHLDRFLERGSIDIEPYQKRVELLKKLNRNNDILPYLKKLSAQEEYSIPIQLLYAKELGADGRFSREAEQLLLKLLKTNIKPELYRELFKLYRSKDMMANVLSMLDEANAQIKPEDPNADRSATETAALRLRAMLDALKGEQATVSALLPVALEELNRKEPRSFNTWYLLATMAARARVNDKAERLFRQCLVNCPPDFEASVYLGLLEILRLGKKHDEIVKLCTEALTGKRSARNTRPAFFHLSAANAHSELDQHDEAIKHADTAIKQSSDDYKVRAIARKIDILSKAGQHDAAITLGKESLKEFDKPALANALRFALAHAHSERGEFEQSEACLTDVLSNDSGSALALNNLGYQWAVRNHNLPQAEKMILEALEIDRRLRRGTDDETDNAAYIDSLAWVYFRQKKYDLALQWLEKAILIPDGADDPTVWDHLGDTYWQLNKPAEAKAAWLKAIDIYKATPRGVKDPKKAEIEKKLKVVKK